MRKTRKTVVYLIYLGAVCTLLFEIAYRYQWVDFYHNELQGLNPELEQNATKPTTLVFGDSFTADLDGWVSKLRKLQPDARIVNAAVPGTGIRETLIMAPDRIEEFTPSTCIYQVYWGNDLMDVDRPANWSALSFTRNVYWQLSDLFLGIRFLNYRLGQVRQWTGDGVDQIDAKQLDAFNVDSYSARAKLYLQTDSALIQQGYFPEDDYTNRLKTIIEGIVELRAELPESCALHVVLVPHCAAVSPQYTDQYLAMGATFNEEWHNFLNDPAASYSSLNELQSAVAGQDITLHDLLPAARALEAQGTDLYYPNDPHFQEAGNTLIATTLDEAIRIR